nr:hypothetical protein [Pseudomonadota bacterium]
GEVFGVEWQGATWVPMAQFEFRNLSWKPALHQVRSELGYRLDDWGVASWLARRNDRLVRHRPIDLLDTDLLAVLQAARADRFIQEG